MLAAGNAEAVIYLSQSPSLCFDSEPESAIVLEKS